MDDYTLGRMLLGNERTKEEKASAIAPSSASFVIMVAESSSSNGEVVVRPDDAESEDIWETGEEGVDYIELSEDGDFDEGEFENVDETDPVDDTPLNRIDEEDWGNCVDIEDGSNVEGDKFDDTEMDEEPEEEAEAPYSEGDAPPGENDAAFDDVDPGDASDVEGDPVTGDALAGGEDYISDTVDEGDAKKLAAGCDPVREDSAVDESDEPTEQVSNGTTKVATTVSVKQGDRVMVAVQDGKMTVVGVVGGGDETQANVEEAQRDIWSTVDSEAMSGAASVHTVADDEYKYSRIEIVASAEGVAVDDEGKEVPFSGRGEIQVGADSGGTTVYALADNISLNTNAGYIGANKPFRADLESATAKDNSTINLSTAFKAIPCTTNRANLSNFINKANDGLEFTKDGWVLLFGTAYCSGLTADDVVSACFYHYAAAGGSTQCPTARTGSTKTSTSIHVPPTVLSVKAGDYVKLAVANLTAARGSAGGSEATSMTAIYLR